jgi:hypothetical protein
LIGLDEFDGMHTDLIEWIKCLLVPNVKICVSSRPWLVFEDAFQSVPNLRLQDLTFKDRMIHVKGHFIRNPGFQLLYTYDATAADQLTEQVVEKSDGGLYECFGHYETSKRFV